LTAYTGLSLVTGFLATIVRADCESILANLAPASGRQDHTVLPYANVPLVSQHACVHRIPARVS
jgi:hypothetical protein